MKLFPTCSDRPYGFLENSILLDGIKEGVTEMTRKGKRITVIRHEHFTLISEPDQYVFCSECSKLVRSGLVLEFRGSRLEHFFHLTCVDQQLRNKFVEMLLCQ